MFFGKRLLHTERTLESEQVTTRSFNGTLRIVAVLTAIILSSFQLYTGAFGIFHTPMVHRAVHLLLVLFLFFLLYPMFKKGSHSEYLLGIDIVIAVIAAATVGYIVLFNDAIANRIGDLQGLNRIDIIVGVAIILFVLEANRRTNKVFFWMIIASLIYMIWGPYMPGMLAHPGIAWERLIYLLSYSSEGIFGTGLAVSSTYLYLFILFGVFLGKTGVTDFFIDLALGLVGKFTGGSAKACVIGSSLMGMVNGSSIGNAVAVGAFTIPLMKRTGFRPHVAAAIEALSSIGGQLMPPVMGAAAFIMAEVTGIPYGQVALAAAIPALLYYINVFAVVHFEAKTSGLKGMPQAELPVLKQTVKNSWYLLLPLIVLMYMLMVANYTVTKAGVAAIICSVAVTYFRKSNHFGLKELKDALVKGAYNAVEIAVLTAGIGVIISAVVLTGLGMRFTTIALAFSGGYLPVVLLMAMIVSIILGMGMPTPVVYLLMAMFAAPSLVQMGVPIIAAHMFVFYFAILSGLTPPVCMVAIVAAGIAQTNWFKVGLEASRMALAAFLIPFMFVFGPQLLFLGHPLEIIQALFTSILGALAIAGSVQGWWISKLRWLERVGMLAASLMLIIPGLTSDLIGLGLLALITATNFFRGRTPDYKLS